MERPSPWLGSVLPSPSFTGVVRVDCSHRLDARELREFGGEVLDRSLAVNLQRDFDKSGLTSPFAIATDSLERTKLLRCDLGHHKACPRRMSKNLPKYASTIDVANADHRDDTG